MTKSTSFIILALGTIVLVILSTIVISRVKRDSVVASEGHPVNAEVFRREVRATLPPGTSLAAVEEFLGSRKVEFSFDPNSRVLHAIVFSDDPGLPRYHQLGKLLLLVQSDSHAEAKLSMSSNSELDQAGPRPCAFDA